MKKLYVFFQLFCLLLFLTSLTHAQPVVADTAFIRASVDSAKKVYTLALRSQSHLYNGSQYIDYEPLEEEHPYYQANDWTTGSIIYDGEKYDNVSLLYDISADKIVAEHFAGAFIDLVTAKVTSFELFGQTFKRFTKADDSKGAITEGFYSVLYDGKTKVLGRYEKQYSETVASMQIKRDFAEKHKYYVVKNKTFYSANTKGAALEVFGDKKKEIRRFIRDQKIKFRGDKGVALVRIAEFYDKLNP